MRFLAGALCCFLFMTGPFLLWQSHAAHCPAPTSAGVTHSSGSSWFGGSSGSDEPLQAPEGSEKTKEEKRFSRADKKDGKVEGEEMLGPSRKVFAKLDVNHNGSLSFEESAVKTITKFQTAEKDKNGWLTRAEFATTAPRKKQHRNSCSCRAQAPTPIVEQAPPDDNSRDNN